MGPSCIRGYQRAQKCDLQIWQDETGQRKEEAMSGERLGEGKAKDSEFGELLPVDYARH